MLLEERECLPTGESRVVLETERLVLRKPSLADVKAIARLANDRRIAQNTAVIPHPYKLSDAEAFVQVAMKSSRERPARRALWRFSQPMVETDWPL